MPYDRVDALLAGEVPAAAVWTGAAYLLEQQGARKILDTTFMAAFMFDTDTNAEDVGQILRRSQTCPDGAGPHARAVQALLPPRIPRFHDLIDVRAFGPGERIVFLPYTARRTSGPNNGCSDRGLFEPTQPSHDFASAVVV